MPAIIGTATTSTGIDYAAAFEELSTLNRLFAHAHDAPALNPKEFEFIESHGPFVVVYGLRSRTCFMADRAQGSASGPRYGMFAPAKKTTRTVTEWKYL